MKTQKRRLMWHGMSSTRCAILGRYSIGTTSYARSATSERVETRSLRGMAFIRSS